MDVTVKDILDKSFLITLNGSKRTKTFVDSYIRCFGKDVPFPRKIIGAQIPSNGGGLPSIGIWSSGKMDHHISCGLTQHTIVSMARALDWPYVAIFEDDAVFIDNGGEYLEKALRELPDTAAVLKIGYNELKGGIYNDAYCKYDFSRVAKIETEHLSIGRSTWGAHSFIIFKRYYDEYLDIIRNEEVICDLVSLSGRATKEPKNPDFRYDAFKTWEKLSVQKNTSEGEADIPIREKIDSDRTFIVDLDPRPGKGGIRSIPPYYLTGHLNQKDGHYFMSAPKAGFMLTMLEMCQFAKSAGWEDFTLVDRKYLESGMLEDFMLPERKGSEAVYGSFGFPLAVRIAKNEYDRLQQDILTSKTESDTIGTLFNMDK